jgi:hypothetical protein
MLSNAAYFPKTFFTSPILRSILPPAFSAVPRSRKSESPAASPVFSFIFPFASSIRPLILFLVLDFTREESALTRILDVDLGLEQLATLVEVPNGPTPGTPRVELEWDPLRGDPRFDKIVTAVMPKTAAK